MTRSKKGASVPPETSTWLVQMHNDDGDVGSWQDVGIVDLPKRAQRHGAIELALERASIMPTSADRFRVLEAESARLYAARFDGFFPVAPEGVDAA